MKNEDEKVDWFKELVIMRDWPEDRTGNVYWDKANSLHALSGNWVTCACGNQCEVIPRDFDGEPRDRELSGLGCDFHQFIEEMKWDEAIDTLRKIEARSTVLIKEINAQQ